MIYSITPYSRSIPTKVEREHRLASLPALSVIRARSWQLLKAILFILLVTFTFGCSSVKKAVNPVLTDGMVPEHTGVTLLKMEQLNSPADDFGVCMPIDTTLLYFTSARTGATGAHSIYWSRLRAGGWTT